MQTNPSERHGESFGTSIWPRVADQQWRIAPFGIIPPHAESILSFLQRGGIDVEVQDSRAIRSHCRAARRDQQGFGAFVAANLNLVRAGLASQRQCQRQVDDATRHHEW